MSSSTITDTEGNIYFPSTVRLNASIEADVGYTPGTLNQTSVVANWGDTVTFSATPAEEEEAEPHIFISYEVTSSPEDGITYKVGETIYIDITIYNDGNVPLHNVEYGSELTGDPWISYTFNVGQTLNQSTAYTLTEAEILAGECVIDLYANAYDPQDTLHNFSNDCTITNIDTPNGELTINAQVSSNPADATTGYKPGETVSFNVNVMNTGNLTLTNIRVTNDLTGDVWILQSLEPDDYVQLNNPYPTYDVTTSDSGNIIIVFEATAISPDPAQPDATVIPAETTINCASLVSQTITVQYISGGSGTCSYSGAVAGNSVSGTISGSTTISGYIGETYNITFSNPPSGYVFDNTGYTKIISGTFRSYNSPIRVYLYTDPNNIEIPEEPEEL